MKTLFLMILLILGLQLVSSVGNRKEITIYQSYQLKEILIGEWRLCTQKHGTIEITGNNCPIVNFLPNNMGFYHSSFDTFIWKESNNIIHFQYLHPQKSNEFSEYYYHFDIGRWGSFLTINLISLDSVHSYELSKWNPK
jgi:hypothetical protein